MCDPNTGKPIHKKIDGIQINDYHFNRCQKGEEKGFCLNDIYTYDDLGLPVTQSASNPPGKNFLYTKDYNIQNGFRIYSCMKGKTPYQKNNPSAKITDGSSYNGEYICKGGRSPTCLPYELHNKDSEYVQCPKNENMLYPKEKMKTIENCMSWCFNNNACNSVNTTYDSTGKLMCNFFSNIDDHSIKTNAIGANIYSKNKDPYIYEPEEGLLKKYKGKYNKYTINCGNYGCCADGVTQANEDGSNCATPMDRTGSPSNKFKYTALGGTNRRVPIDDKSGSSYINYNEVPEQFINYTSNRSNNYILKYIIILFIIVVAILIYSKYNV